MTEWLLCALCSGRWLGNAAQGSSLQAGATPAQAAAMLRELAQAISAGQGLPMPPAASAPATLALPPQQPPPLPAAAAAPHSMVFGFPTSCSGAAGAESLSLHAGSMDKAMRAAVFGPKAQVRSHVWCPLRHA